MHVSISFLVLNTPALQGFDATIAGIPRDTDNLFVTDVTRILVEQSSIIYLLRL